MGTCPPPPPLFIVSQIMPFARFSSFSLCTCLLYERNYSECQSSQRKCLKIVFVFVSNWNLFGVLSFSRISNSDAVPGKSAGLLLSVELFIGGSFERRVSVSVSGYWMQFDIIIFICRIVLSVCWTNERKWHQLRLVMYKWPLLPLPHIRAHTHTLTGCEPQHNFTISNEIIDVSNRIGAIEYIAFCIESHLFCWSWSVMLVWYRGIILLTEFNRSVVFDTAHTCNACNRWSA